jgi:hypothetical protein
MTSTSRGSFPTLEAKDNARLPGVTVARSTYRPSAFDTTFWATTTTSCSASSGPRVCVSWQITSRRSVPGSTNGKSGTAISSNGRLASVVCITWIFTSRLKENRELHRTGAAFEPATRRCVLRVKKSPRRIDGRGRTVGGGKFSERRFLRRCGPHAQPVFTRTGTNSESEAPTAATEWKKPFCH